MVLKTFGWSFAVTAIGLVAAVLYGGWTAFGVVLILSILEISLSFDNAVVNAGILKKMSAFWQKIFLTIGILIAVFGMRLVFPVVIVAITADACYTQENMDRDVLPTIVWDTAEMSRSLGALRRLRDAQGARVFFGHDPAQWAATPQAPAVFA